MFLLQTFIMPHPPLIVPAVGKGKEKGIQSTIDACERAAKEISEIKPDLIIFITPHCCMYEDYIHLSPGDGAKGDLSRFGAPGERFALPYDDEFIWHTETLAKEKNIPAGTLGGRDKYDLDHGVTVPLHFINKYYNDYKAVRISTAGLPVETHYRFGKLLSDAIHDMKRKTVIVASGDLSHRLTQDGPYGFTKEGLEFDKQLCDALSHGNFINLLQFEPSFTEKAAECGLRSFIIMAGALDGLDVKSIQLSYEGPFGVGYGVFSFKPAVENSERCLLNAYENFISQKLNALRKNESPYVKLARETLEHFITHNRMPPLPEDILPDMVNKKAGTFVSIKKDGRLRGCIGTTEPYREHIAEEIRGNAISAGTRDPRFDTITPEELPHLVYSVDILSPSEPISSRADLNVHKYGVIVTHGVKRGLLLPNLDGVDTVSQQISIALQKAGIDPSSDYQLSRFEVVRHT